MKRVEVGWSWERGYLLLSPTQTIQQEYGKRRLRGCRGHGNGFPYSQDGFAVFSKGLS